jgi:hypothetical protein
MNWIRENFDRLVLSLVGIVVFAIGIAIREQQGLAIILVFIGGALFFFGIVLRRAQFLSVGTKGFEARLGELERKVDKQGIRTALADFIAQGDRAVNELMNARESVIHDLRNHVEPRVSPAVWNQIAAFQYGVVDYLRATPELGEAEATLFMAQVDGLVIPLTMPERFDGEIALIRARQQRIHDLMRRFE